MRPRSIAILQLPAVPLVMRVLQGRGKWCNNLDSAPQAVPALVDKVVQLFSCKAARRANVLVGDTGSGKTAAWQCLQRALLRLRREGPADPLYRTVGLTDTQSRQ